MLEFGYGRRRMRRRNNIVATIVGVGDSGVGEGEEDELSIVAAIVGVGVGDSGVGEGEEDELKACRSRQVAAHAIKLDHHVIEAFVVGDRDKGIEVLAWKLVLEADIGTGNGGELGSEGGQLDVAVDSEDLVAVTDIGDLIVVGDVKKKLGVLTMHWQCISVWIVI